MLEFNSTRKENNRKRLTKCAPRFAHATIGGKEGKFYVVTEPSNDIGNPNPGTLCHVVTHTQPLWITFKESIAIKLE
ncbi:hypothetical protein Golob_011602 [Gossypium lobatum]|uniref:Uncharacterized protein n=1 Tax=Gossypium lobatum TaxID=34289 RepID=A0A7J8MQ93_9ROSI|nr:hypothetical protein [Gossypium lobatum]